jgi:hypothetical protein
MKEPEMLSVGDSAINRDERSMKVLELFISSLALVVAVLLALVPGAR